MVRQVDWGSGGRIGMKLMMLVGWKLGYQLQEWLAITKNGRWGGDCGMGNRGKCYFG